MVINKKSKQSAHREAYTKQSHAAERKEGPGKVSVKVKEEEQPEEHGIGSGAGLKGGLDSRAFAKEFLDARDPIVFANDGPDNGSEEQEVEITILVNSGVRVPK